LTAPASHTTAHNTAWEISGSFLLTDDTASFRSVNPKRPFDLKTGGWGAWELIARVGQLEVDKGLFTGGAASFADPTKSARRATAWGVGLNWYLNKWARAYLDYEQTAFDRGAATGDRPDEKTLFTRLQLLF
jgi:phosphate-selective porin OprO/OprP